MAPCRQHFNPLPLRRGRRGTITIPGVYIDISIHSLFAEGDYEEMEAAEAEAKISIHSLFAEGDPLCFRRYSQKGISIHSLFAEGDSKNAQKYLLPTYILHTKPTITQANPSLKLIFSNLFSKLTPFSRCESPTHFMCTYHSHLNHISNFFKPVPSPQLFPLFRYFDPG